MTAVHEHDCVVLTGDRPDKNLRAGAAYEVEFTTLTGQTIAVATLEVSKLRPISQTDISHVRKMVAV